MTRVAKAGARPKTVASRAGSSAGQELSAVEAAVIGIASENLAHDELSQSVASLLCEHVDAEFVSVFITPIEAGDLLGAVEPVGQMPPGGWERLSAAVNHPGNEGLYEALLHAPWVRDNLEDGDAVSPVERWALEELGVRSLVVVRATPWEADRAAVISVARRQPGTWEPEAVAFFERIVQIVQLAAEGTRARALLARLQERADAQARLLTSLDATPPLRELAATFVSELYTRFQVQCRAMVARRPESGEMTILYVAPELDEDAVLTRLAGGSGGAAATEPALERGAVLPIGEGEEPWGFAYVEAAAGTPNSELRTRIADVLRPLAFMVERAGLVAAAEERRQTVAYLLQVIGTVNPATPPEVAAKLFARHVRPLLGADTVIVAAFDQVDGRRGFFEIDSEAPDLSADDLQGALLRGMRMEDIVAEPAWILDSRHLDDAPAWVVESRVQDYVGSAICVRLDSDGLPIGLVAASTAKVGQLGQPALELLREVAGPLAVLFERAHTMTSLRRQTERTQQMVDVLAALGPKESIEELAEPVAQAIRAMSGADYCWITVVQDGAVTLAAVDPRRSGERLPGMRLEALISQRLQEEAQRLREAGFDNVGDVEQLPSTAPLRKALTGTGARSVLRVVVGPPATPLGAVAIASQRRNAFTAADAAELLQVVQPLAMAIGYFRAKQQQSRRGVALAHANQVLERLSAPGTRATLAAAFLQECRSLFGVEHGVVLAFEGQRPEILAVESTCWQAGEREVRPPIGATLATLRSQEEPAVLSPRGNGSEARMIRGLGLCSGMSVPLTAGGNPAGTVVVWSGQRAQYGPDELSELSTLARSLAVALEKARATERLSESERKYRSVVSDAEELILLVDPEALAILEANPFCERSLGYGQNQLQEMRLPDLIPEEPEAVASRLKGLLEGSATHLGDTPFRRSDGGTIEVDVMASVVSLQGQQALLILGRDVSDWRAMQRQLMQSQKMESLGAMAGNVAHDFNNLLTTILGFAGLLKREPGIDAEAREQVELIEDAARRAANLTGRLLSFARGGLVEFGPIDVRKVIDDTVRLAEAGLPPRIAITTRLPGRPVVVEGDPGQLQQALLNMLINARDAIPREGTIALRVRTAGDRCTLTVSDTGTGMDEETRTHLFEPFYTTKEAGRGTGLGMSITYGIVQGHHGEISVASREGHGTTFTVVLPLLRESPESGAADETGQAILVVDDDDLVRQTLRATLEDLGYRVVAASGGSEALDALRSEPERFAAALLDLAMPAMSGRETFEAMREIRPDLPVIICTGYGGNRQVDADIMRRAVATVQKPFTRDSLARALQLAGAEPRQVS